MFSWSIGDLGRRTRARPGGDEDRRRLDLARRPVERLHLDHPVGQEAGAAVKEADAVALQLSPHVGDVRLDHLVETRRQRCHLEIGLEGEFEQRGAAAQARQLERALAQGLAGDRAAVDAHPADAGLLLDQRDPAPRLDRLHGGLLPRGAAAQHQHVEDRGVVGVAAARGVVRASAAAVHHQATIAETSSSTRSRRASRPATSSG